MKTIITAAIAITAIAAPAHALTQSEAYAGGALYGVTCAVAKGKVSEDIAALALRKTLSAEGIPVSYATRPSVIKAAKLMFIAKGGC